MIYELPPNGQGFAALQMLNILKQIDLRDYPKFGRAFHCMVEAKRLAFEGIARYYADGLRRSPESYCRGPTVRAICLIDPARPRSLVRVN